MTYYLEVLLVEPNGHCLVHLFLHPHCISIHGMLEASVKAAFSDSIINTFTPSILADPEGLVYRN